MSDIFGPDYASNYDFFYQGKDYQAECDLLERIFHKYARKTVQSILDLGCGTGNHAIPLAQRGYYVTGVDRSPEMLAIAHDKLLQQTISLPVTLHQGGMESFSLNKKFDVVLMMFAVLGYQLDNKQIRLALTNANQHLNREGLLIFDVWFGPAVLSQRPTERLKIIQADDKQIIRWSAGTVDINHHTCFVNYHIWELSQGNPAKETEETHQMRFFFPLELELILENSGFRLLRLGVFPEIERVPDESTWNVIVVAGTDEV